ncbi:MAG: undecaprenyldiphospho-muramoylpentapeptide beta-N-acetylglucosaminyltransferase [Bacteroidales bacterium]|nr:undecaprenyldiphospho-muramoylpentapeptide beta-N-acetylglucosaminyltransferase [Bacteroidales bacterium]
MSKAFKIIISGGGTGGHIFPAIAIANQIKEQYAQAEILFVGALGRMEMEKVPAAGYPIIGLPVAGLQRRAFFKNLTLPGKVWKSLGHAKKIIKDFQPHVVVGVGGYASGPILWVATRNKIPCLIQEQNSYAGVTNKLLAKKVQTVCAAYQGMERFFPKEKIRLTGNPVRSSIVPVTGSLKNQGRTFFGIEPERATILIVGGSLGARALNDCVQAFVKENPVESPVDIIWQCGGYYSAQNEAFMAAHPRPWIHLHPFIHQMELAFAAADLVISRAGAGTISELCVAGKAVIFVPSPNVSEDHQMHNAMALVRQNAALVVPENQVSVFLMNRALDLINNREQRALLEANMSKLARPQATKDIVSEIVKLIEN